MKVLVLDNYDSFVYNLVQLLGELGADPQVYRNDKIDLENARKLQPDAIVVSPGPGDCADKRYFGSSAEIIKELGETTPLLGVCLGHQGIVHVFGGVIVRAKKIMHGKTSMIHHDGKGVFKGVKNPFEATRYHSLVAKPDAIPDVLEVSAKSEDDGEVMGVRHRSFPIEGVQFHPESILTKDGRRIMKNFLEMSKR